MSHTHYRRRLPAILGVVLAAAAAGAAEPGWYVRKGTWQETMYASREALARELAAQDDKLRAAGGGVQLGPWYTSKPLKATSLATVLPPEQGAYPTADVPAAKGLWKRRGNWQDGVIHHLGGGPNRAVYVFRTIRAPKATGLTIYFGCDDHMMIFLNGATVHTCTKRHGVRPNEHTLRLALRAGENKLLLKVRDVGGVHAFYFHTSRTPRKASESHEAQLWSLLRRDFPGEAAGREMNWEQADRIWQIDWDKQATRRLIDRYVRAGKLPRAAGAGELSAVRELYYGAKRTAELGEELRAINLPALRRAIDDLADTFGERYDRDGRFRRRLAEFEKRLPAIAKGLAAGEKSAAAEAAELAALRREALLANPLLNFDKLLMVRRDAKAPRLGLPANWQGNCSLPRSGYDDAIVVLSPVRPGGKITTLFEPKTPRFVGDVDLHFDADRMLFSMPDDRKRWHVFEVRADGGGLRQLTGLDQPDVDDYDGCYLPDGRIIYGSTACMQGVPCVRGGSHVANLCLLDPRTKAVRQLCFDQDHNWCPTVLPTGRVLYTRWEYSDIPHAFSRILFHMAPDGTGQMEYYGSNSYWPNSIFYARPIPGSPTKFVGVVSGHHGVARIGELVLFDHARGRHEADGVIQRIGDWGKPVEPILLDHLVDRSWPKFLHPWPLSERYFLVSAQPTRGAPWCVYLADVFDNLLKLCELPGYALLEPIPFRQTPRPPVVADRVDTRRKDAVVYMTDVYRGPGLAGVPRGAVRRLRLFTYHFAYWGMGAQQDRVGLDGPWDIKRVLGTVPVYADGSAKFRVPANTPISLQPLDANGQAIQLMRSWLTAMPGEQLSCVGCHERQSDAPAAAPQPIAFTRPASEIQPWHGPVRGFSFRREVQPVLDRYCIGCHNDKHAIDLRAKPPIVVHPIKRQHGMGRYSPSYYAVRRFVRSPTIESDLHLLPPWEFHAESTKLVQMLRKGHHGVRLNAEAWDRIVTWIDLHAPAHGTWHETVGMNRVTAQRDRRRALRKLYAGIDEDPEAIPPPPAGASKCVAPTATVWRAGPAPACPGWPFDAAEAGRRQAVGGNYRRSVELGGGVKLELVRIPPGEFVMGDAAGHPDERPPARVKIGQAFWVGTCEVTNEQYRRFDPSHDSRLEHGHFLQFSVRERGYPLNGPRQPVVRVSWLRAAAFCRWLSQRTGLRFALPTEAQWEYACRAGTATPLSYGRADTDHAGHANLADRSVKEIQSLGWALPHGAIPEWHPTEGRFNDTARVSADVGGYRANAWGLHDMHGNVCEWTRTNYRPYPYRRDDGRNDGSAKARKVVRGGSWYDRPRRGRSAFRLSYRPCQSVYDVGFRVACEGPPQPPAE